MKEKIWASCSVSVIGTKQPRRGSNIRPKHEFELDDILDALATCMLEGGDQMPDISISAYELHLIPRSHPEEIMNISVVDRLNRMERRIDGLQGSLDSTIAQNMELRDELSEIKLQSVSYANAAKSVPRNIGHNTSGHNPGKHGPGEPRPYITRSDGESSQQPHQLDNPISGSSRSDNLNQRDNNSFRMRPGLLPSQRTASVISLDRGSASSFEFQPHQRKRQKQLNRLIGRKAGTGGNFKGAPEPQRYIFIYRVDAHVTVNDIIKHVQDYSINVLKLECVSNVNAKYKSFRLTTGISDFKRLLSDDLWPKGVCIRKFIPRRNNDNIHNDGEQD